MKLVYFQKEQRTITKQLNKSYFIRNVLPIMYKIIHQIPFSSVIICSRLHHLIQHQNSYPYHCLPHHFRHQSLDAFSLFGTMSLYIVSCIYYDHICKSNKSTILKERHVIYLNKNITFYIHLQKCFFHKLAKQMEK